MSTLKNFKIRVKDYTYFILTPYMFRRLRNHIRQHGLSWPAGYHPRFRVGRITQFSRNMIKVIPGNQAPTLVGSGYEKWNMQWRNGCGSTMHYAPSDRKMIVGIDWF